MNVQFSAEVNRDDVREALRLFDHLGQNSTKALVRGINRTLPKVRTRSSQEIRKQVRLPAAYLKERLVTRKASLKKPTGAVSASRRGLLLSRFDTNTAVSRAGKGNFASRPPPIPKNGIRVKVKPKGAAKAAAAGSRKWFYLYIPTGSTRTLAIGARKSTAGPQGGTIDILYGPSVSQVWNKTRNVVEPFGTAEYERQVLRAVDDLLRLRQIKIT